MGCLVYNMQFNDYLIIFCNRKISSVIINYKAIFSIQSYNIELLVEIFSNDVEILINPWSNINLLIWNIKE